MIHFLSVPEWFSFFDSIDNVLFCWGFFWVLFCWFFLVCACLFCCCCCNVVVLRQVSLCISGSLETCYIDQAGLKVIRFSCLLGAGTKGEHHCNQITLFRLAQFKHWLLLTGKQDRTIFMHGEWGRGSKGIFVHVS